jgi:hypothetical protein
MLAGVATTYPAEALARGTDQSAQIEELQREVATLKAQMRALLDARVAAAPRSPAPASLANPDSERPITGLAATPTEPMVPALASTVAPQTAAAERTKKAWYEKLTLRGYTQLRVNEIVSGDRTAPTGISRLRSVQDAGLTDKGNFSIRRARLVVQGELSNHVSLYMQGDMASSVSNQSSNERRDGFFQMRDAYVDLHIGRQRTFKLRLGQSKLPVGWENLQSSSNRLPLDRSDAINSATVGERDIGVVAYYTPPQVQRIWDALAKDGQKLFGNYGAFGLGVFNGQGINRAEPNNGLMKVGFATWPVELGGPLKGQVIEFGGALMHNTVQPEIRSGGVSPLAYDDRRVSLHAMLYPKPIGLQAEWAWGHAPAWNRTVNGLAKHPLNGGYVMASYRMAQTSFGSVMPFARWQYYRGGWKGAVNAPLLETNELEIGVEWQPIKELELTMSVGDTRRSEADERRIGQAKGQVARAQIQWNY